jgi:hypothetical protein
MKPKTEERIQHVSGWAVGIILMAPYMLFSYRGDGLRLSFGRNMLTIFLAFLSYAIGRLVGLGIVMILKKTGR